ncbi:MAG TPA: PEP-CTERM sorting domain-containing protein [Myxococcota bacterium]|nr:PEP-CTERM sorting domain-containing protein [Myxococcota bacterium]
MPALSLTIDNFEQGNFSVVDVAPGPTLGQQAGLAPDVIGGVRLVRSNATSGGTTTSSLTTTAGPDGAVVSFADAAAPFGQGDASFIYDGIPDGAINGPGGALNLDLSTFYSIDVEAAATPGIADLQLTLWDAAGSQGSALIPILNGNNPFVLSSFGLVNLTQIKSIRLSVFGLDPGESVQIADISANETPVPEPGTGFLLALGLAGLALRRPH